MTIDRPHSKHAHVFGVVRVDVPAGAGGSWSDDRIAGTKAFRTKDEAVAEAERMNELNAAKGGRYVVVYLRLVEGRDDAT